MTQPTIKIDAVSDIACPWCYIGKHRIEEAIGKWTKTPIEIEWHPYLLNPTIPAEGWDRKTYSIKKFGTADRPDAMNRVEEAGKSVGITFNFGDQWLGVPTLPLHQLMHIAGEEGFKSELKERLFYAYFTENLHLNDTETLVELMNEFGWDREKTQKILNDADLAKKVSEEIEAYQEKGITGVPFFIIDGKYGVSGAQAPETFLDIFEQVSNERLFGGVEGDACGIDGDCPI